MTLIYVFTQIIVVLLCILMFKVKRPHKLAIFLFSMVCLSSITITGIPFGGTKYIIASGFILSEISYVVRHFRCIKDTVIYPCLIVFLLSMVILIINSPHYNRDPFQMMRLIVLEGIGNYFALCYGVVCIASERDLKPAVVVSFWSLLILTIFGVLNLIMKEAIFVEATVGDQNMFLQDLGSIYKNSDRFRVQAMFGSPFNYGYMCVLLLLFHFYAYLKSMMQKKYLFISVACCLFGIFSCGCRINLLCIIIGIISFLLIAFNIWGRLKLGIIFLIAFCVGYMFLPIMQKKVNEMATMFNTSTGTGTGSVEGSSISMRIIQYKKVFYYIQGYELFGRGKDFFYIDLGWQDIGTKETVEKDLYGLEGVLMNILLERGIIGVIFYLSIYYMLFRFIYINRKKDRLTSALCFSVLISYMTFANATGDLGSVFPTLFIVGIGIKILYISNVQKCLL